MKKAFVLVIFCVFASLAFGQSKEVDNLRQALQNYPQEDTTKIRLLTELAWWRYYFNQDTTLVLLNQALTVAEKLKEARAIGIANRELAYCYAYYNLKEYDKALEYERKALQSIEKTKDKLQISLVLLDIGHLYALKNQNQEALNYFFKALEGFEALKNQEHITYALLDIKVAYEKMGNKEKTTEFSEKLNQAISKITDKSQLAKIWFCIAGIEFWKSQFNEVLEYSLKSEKIYEEVDDVKRKRSLLAYIVFLYHGIAKSYNDDTAVSKTVLYAEKLLKLIEKDNQQAFNPIGFQDKQLAYYHQWVGIGFISGNEPLAANNFMGWVYSWKNRDLEKAKQYHLKAKAFAEKEKDKFGLNLSIDGLGQVYFFQGRYQEALDIFLQLSRDNTSFQKSLIAQCYQKLGKPQEALQYALKAEKETPQTNVFWYTGVNALLSEIYADLKQYEQAYFYQKKVQMLSDTLKVQENLQKIAELEKQREITLLEKDKQIQAEENKNQRLWLFSASGAFLSAVLLAFILYRNSQNKQKANSLLQEKNEEITQQTQALQNKNRELEIEAALERVRSQSLAMHRSEELLGVITAVFQQLEQLDFNITTASLSLGYRENPFKYWMAVTGQPYPTEIDVPYADIAFMKFFQESATNNNGLITATFNKLQKDEWVHHIIEHTIVKYAPNERKKSMVDAPGITLSVATIKNIALAISNYSLVTYTNAENEILKRFARVFEQAYTRFLDLQKAEAQAREAQIEVALEKIRSRSLAMHYSSELREVIAVFFEKLNELKVLLGTVGITLFDNNSRDIIYWVGNSIQAPQLISVPYNEALMLDENFVRDGWVAMTEKKEYINKYYTRIQKDRFFEHLFSNNDLMQIPESAREILKGMESHIVCFLPYNNFGMFVDSWDGRVYEEEDLKVVKRAAKVFEQSYTRFLDLQKAEAQAREAQIEAALERVRSRTMAMQKSEELTEVVSTVFNQFKELGFALNDDGAAAILIFSDDSKNHTQWIADRWQSYAHPFKVDYTEHSLSSDIYNAKESGIDFFSKLYSVEEKNTYFEYLFNESEYFKQVPEEVKNMIFASENYGISVAFGKQHAAMLIPTNTGKLLEEDEKEILKRFVAVFEQTYTRFLDLQKAEAQAREAQIEAALERVRSQAMSMQKSDELATIIRLINQELVKLDTNLDRSFIMLIDANEGGATWWMASSVEPSLLQGYQIPYHDHPPHIAYLEAWKKQISRWEYILTGNEKKQWDEFLFNQTELSQLPKFIISNMTGFDTAYLSASFNKYGCISTGSFTPITPISMDLLVRFSYMFEQTYTRFLDLQKAEAQAREAQIEAALERVRSRTMAMQKSDELAEAANLMSNEVRGLGIPIWSCGYNIFEEDEKSCIGWMSTEGSIQPSFRIPLKVSQTFIKFYESRQNGEEFYEEKIGSRDLETHYNYMLTLDGFADILKGFLNAGHKLPTFQVNTVVNFAQGNLIFISAEPIPEAHEIFKRFAKVFEQTYTRFRDLQLKEQQAVELEEEKQKLKESYEELAQTNVALNYAFNQIEKKNEDITASINAALRIQSAMLPVPAHFENVFGKENYFVLFKPRDIVSGDFYFLEEVEDKIVLVCADCTGHGVPGAFMSMIGNQILTEIVGKEQITEPDQILNRLNKEINKVLKQNENQGREGMDIAVVTFTKNPQGFENLMGFGKVEYAGAMNPIYYVASDFPNQALSNSDLESQATLKEIKADKKPIGGIQEEDEKTFTKHEIQLSITNEQLSIKQQNSQQFNNLTIQQSTILYLCSDGFQDQFGGAQGKKFMVKRFRELLSSIHHLPMHEQRQVLDDTIEKWMAEGKEHQIDDILVVGIRV